MIGGFDFTGNWNGKDVEIKLEKTLFSSLYEAGLAAESFAKTIVPVDTGRLKGSITTSSNKESTNTASPAKPVDKIDPPQEIYMVHVGVGSNVEYALYQEFGGGKLRAQPYLRPALDYVEGKALQITYENGKAELREYL